MNIMKKKITLLIKSSKNGKQSFIKYTDENLNSIYSSTLNFFKNKKYIEYGDNAKLFSQNFYWNKVVKDYLKLIN